MGSSGSSGGASIDYEYNARLAEIAEAQQLLSEEMMYYYREFGLPYDVEQTEALRALLPYQTDYEAAQLQAETGLTGLRASLEESQIAATQALIPDQQKFLTTQLQTEQALTKRRGSLESAQLLSELGLVPQKTALEEAQLQAETSLTPQRTATELAQLQATQQLTPEQTRLALAQLQAERGLTPQRAQYEAAQLGAGMQLIPAQTQAQLGQLGLQSGYYNAAQQAGLPQQMADTRSMFLKEAMEGIDISGRVGRAQADVVKGFQGALASQRMMDSRMGIRPDSGASQQRAQDLAIQKAGAITGARTQARTKAEDENFNRLQTASGLGLGF
jgi:hypothetical protein